VIPTREQILKLAAWHIDHFTNLLARGLEGDFSALAAQCQREINDAIGCGDFDVLLGLEGDAS
jgi:hypothetical protein